MAKEIKPKAATGTDRVIRDGKPFIPDPPAEAVKPQPVAAKPAPTSTDRSAQAAEIPMLHLDHAQARLTRLKLMARTSREVSWLLNEYTKLSATN